LNGEDRYLGKHKSPESRAKYDRLVAEWMAAGRQLPTDPATITVAEVVAAFRRHAKTYYRRPDGSPSSEVKNFDHALRPLLRLYGRVEAENFGPRALAAVRVEMIGLGWVRTSVNKNVTRIKQVFKWAVAQEMIDPAVFHGLAAVAGLGLGRSEAKESQPVKPIALDHARAIKPHVSPEVAAMIEIQLLTGMRPGEICIMRGCDLEIVSDDLWLYHPSTHKTLHHGHERTVYFGPKAIGVVQPFLLPDTRAFLFSPSNAETARRGESKGRGKRRPRHIPGDHYDTVAYAKAIYSGCARAFPPPADLARQRVQGHGRKARSTRWESKHEWQKRLGEKSWMKLVAWQQGHRFHPHQLRHTAATELRKTHGLEAAQVLLGHKNVRITELYAEKNLSTAMQIVKAVG
jgi:integrase